MRHRFSPFIERYHARRSIFERCTELPAHDSFHAHARRHVNGRRPIGVVTLTTDEGAFQAARGRGNNVRPVISVPHGAIALHQVTWAMRSHF